MKIAQFIQDNRSYFEDFITRSTYHSNAIEGSTLSYAETYAIIFNDNSVTIKATARELYEAINHKYAIDYLLKHLDQPLSAGMIQHLAQTIGKNVNEFTGYRKSQVFIQGAEHIPPAPQQVPSKMMYLLEHYHNGTYETVYDKIAEFHTAFERIHPFEDGNGRTGRLLMNYELLRQNLPPVVIVKDARAEYLAMLAGEDIKALAQFIRELSEKERERIRIFEHANETVDKQMADSLASLNQVDTPTAAEALRQDAATTVPYELAL